MLKDKALENLAAGEELLDRGRVNAGVSRLYYAMFQAAVHRFEVLGVAPRHVRSGADRWQHTMIAKHARVLRGRATDRDLYNDVMELRVTADYFDRAVRLEAVTEHRAQIRDFVRELAR